MKICIDITPIGIRTTDKGGVYRYIFKLVESLSQLDQKNHYTLFLNFFKKEHLATFYETLNRLQSGKNFQIRLFRFPTRLLRLFEPPIEFLTGRFDIFHGCFDYLPRILFGKGVVTIHDVRYLENFENETDQKWIHILREISSSPEFYTRDYLARSSLFNHLKKTVMKTIKKADVIITVSQFSKSRIEKLLGIPTEKVKVVYQGIDSKFRPLRREEIGPVLKNRGIKKPYVIYVGKFDPLKNIFRFLEAFKKVTFAHNVNLVMVGPINWFYYIVLEKLKELDITDRVIFTNFITDNEIVALYNGASLFVLPSLYEGFGIPLVEAMACGAPIVTSNICSMPEVVDDGALQVDPYSVCSIAEGMDKVLSDKHLCKELVSRGLERAKLFTWEKTARETLTVYQEVCLR